MTSTISMLSMAIEGDRAVLAVSIASILIIGALAAAATARKLARDRRAMASSVRRAQFAAVLADDDDDSLAAALEAKARTIEGQLDLLFALTGASGTRRRRVLEAAKRTGISERLHAELVSSKPVTRGTALLLLSEFADETVIPAASQALADSDPDVRLAAARSLSLLVPAPEAVRALVRGLRDSVLPPQRLIERMSDPLAAPTLLTVLSASMHSADEGEPSRRMRAGIARALGLMGAPLAEPLLVRLLLDGSPEEQISAARALGSCGTARSFPALRLALANGSDSVRNQAAAALGDLASVESVADLEDALEDSSWWVRSNAAVALGKLGDAGEQALRRAASGTDRFAAERASEQLLLLHGIPAVPGRSGQSGAGE